MGHVLRLPTFQLSDCLQSGRNCHRPAFAREPVWSLAMHIHFQGSHFLPRRSALCVGLLSALASLPALAQDDPVVSSSASTSSKAKELDKTVVVGHRENLVGEAISASKGSIGQAEIAARPTNRTADLLEFVPGNGWLASARFRHFGHYALIEDNSVRSNDSNLVNLWAGREWNRYGVFLDVLNVLNSRDHDVDYCFASRLKGELGRQRHPLPCL
jgi:hypothetical protein